ncbi:DUF6177 family protein [Streptomyces sp. 4N509B]|uniref:DUF6177 family protein n=1 Tax=Streptomyces sp. 4N509B TaxID=3457413 RepID=UPI003FD4796D
MTTDVIALTERMPDAWALVAGLAAGGPAARVEVPDGGRGAVVQLHDAAGRPLVSVEAPQLVHAPGEARRLLGVTVPGPVWWTEVRAATAVERGAELAGTIATRLVTLLGGTVWPPGAAARDRGGAAVAGVTATAVPAAAQPAVDVLTARAAAVIQDRPVVALTAWLSDALRAAGESGRAFQLVTPRASRLTLPLRAALTGLPNRWVVRDGAGGYFDGLSGAVLRWQDGAFAAAAAPAPPRPAPAAPGPAPDAAPAPDAGVVSPAYVEATRRAATEAAAGDGPGHQLLLGFVTRAPAEDGLLLGGALEAAWRRLTGTDGPRAWGTAEPATLGWSREELTDLARRRAPRPSWFLAVGETTAGPDALATLRVARTTGGVEEDVTLAVPLRPPPEAELRALAADLAAHHGLVSLLVQRRRARADLTVPAHLEEPPSPLAFVLGGEGVDEVDRDHASRPPHPHPAPARVGPGLYYALPGAEGWDGFQRLMGHLHTGHRHRRHQEPAGPVT